MRTFLFFILFVWLSFSGMAQEVTGDWFGLLEFPGAKLRLVLHVSGHDGQYKAILDSPDQGVKGIPADVFRYDSSGLVVHFTSISAEYKGKYADGQLKGVFTQLNHPVALSFSREEVKRQRPQEPIAPYPYYSENVVFKNPEAGISLAGTLTLPQKEGKFPAVVLITGSGPQNRDEELMEHKPFLVLADYLTRQGIAVLRFDDRGVGESEGVFAGATTLDFAGDVTAAVNYLRSRKEICKSAIGLAGHSEGGMIAPVVASADRDIAFIVLMAGVGISGKELLLQQSVDLLEAGNAPAGYIKKMAQLNREAYGILMNYPQDQARPLLDSLLQAELPFLANGAVLTPEQKKQFVQQRLMTMMSPWFREFLAFQPEKYLRDVKCAVLALNGKKDLQVNARQNLEAICQILHENKNTKVDTLYLPDLNHLFQNCNKGLPAEYAFIEETISPEVLKIIAEWIVKTVK